MAGKRCYNKNEAIDYFGINRNAFEKYIEPELEGKGIRIGDCLTYEAYDLDMAWDSFKTKAKGAAGASRRLFEVPSPDVLGLVAARGNESAPSADLGSAAWNATVKKILAKGRWRKR